MFESAVDGFFGSRPAKTQFAHHPYQIGSDELSRGSQFGPMRTHFPPLEANRALKWLLLSVNDLGRLWSRQARVFRRDSRQVAGPLGGRERVAPLHAQGGARGVCVQGPFADDSCGPGADECGAAVEETAIVDDAHIGRQRIRRAARVGQIPAPEQLVTAGGHQESFVRAEGKPVDCGTGIGEVPHLQWPCGVGHVQT